MKGIRWFLSEFFVVVSGVLVAFALNSYWQEVSNNKKEKLYIQQIKRELDSTIFRIEDNLNYMGSNLEGCANLVTYTYAKELPPDSIIFPNIYQALNSSTSGQVSGTLQSLITSGEIQLISDDNLRTTLVKLEDNLKHFDELSIRIAHDKLWPHLEEVLVKVNWFDISVMNLPEEELRKMAEDSLSPLDDLDNIKYPPRVNFEQLFSDQELKDDIIKLYMASSSLYGIQSSFLVELKKVRAQLENEINGWDDSNAGQQTGIDRSVKDSVNREGEGDSIF